jgi:heme-degrading monooxygenase HmoA
MAVAEIMHFSPPTTLDDTIEKAVKALKGVRTPQHFVIGTQVQDKGALQIMSEWDGVQDYADFGRSVRNICGEPHNVFRVVLDRSAFEADGPAAANVVEFVQTYFPASRVTPELQKQVEADYSKFDEIFSKGAKGRVSRASGWVLEEQEHKYDNIKGEKAKCFFVVTGWESMDRFDRSVNTDAFKEAIPLLLSWNAPFKMVGVCFAV